MAEVTEWGNARSITINEEGRAKMLESGRTEIIELTDEELVVWQDSVQTVWDQFSDEIGSEIIEAAQREAIRR